MKFKTIIVYLRVHNIVYDTCYVPTPSRIPQLPRSMFGLIRYRYYTVILTMRPWFHWVSNWNWTVRSIFWNNNGTVIPIAVFFFLLVNLAWVLNFRVTTSVFDFHVKCSSRACLVRSNEWVRVCLCQISRLNSVFQTLIPRTLRSKNESYINTDICMYRNKSPKSWLMDEQRSVLLFSRFGRVSKEYIIPRSSSFYSFFFCRPI